MDKIEKKTLKIDEDLSLPFLGPPLSNGPCPTVIYFALSAEDSLHLDPYNQPALFLSSYPIRVFSVTLPGHENCMSAKNALAVWANEISHENNIISSFVDKAIKGIKYLIDENLSDPSGIALMGLSRGAYLALHVGAKSPDIKWILGFSPLIDLSIVSEFDSLKESRLLQSLHPNNLALSLLDKEIRLYIGNRDTRVGTRNSFSFVEKIAEEAYLKKKKKADAELIIYPSIGHKGHGTSKNTFKEGCLWLQEKLLNQGPRL
jgi:hypothetical protein